ncbi:hypothetical protein ASPFODRAFT_221072 [Aspergillus luchuensis CBS 106.47]|uniref:Uncharacterized protein n=1 Tax=Aspergillus luchuensis (strain CBS 106.47) TaxID=1137211 RepID=A0A1M3T8F8_ASPLC|nr:hypothetical protein ASPFODRAFT_221072 [Aspergillus luchuensis CBS 106.47]
MAKQRIHLAAAREGILAGAGRPGLEHPHHRVEQFLLQGVYEISAWTQLTTFSRVDNILMDPPTSNQTRPMLWPQTWPRRQRPSFNLYALIESAKSQNLSIIESIGFWSDIERRDFELVVSMYSHATLVYISQALSGLSGAEADKDYSCSRILDCLQQLTYTRNRLRFTQDLV